LINMSHEIKNYPGRTSSPAYFGESLNSLSALVF
jgi:hypothetical protein